MNRKTPVTSYLDIDDVQALEEISKKTEVSLSMLIREAVKTFLSRKQESE